jgi:hypothetical protein
VTPLALDLSGASLSPCAWCPLPAVCLDRRDSIGPLPAISLDGHTFLALYGQKAHPWLRRLWHTGCAHASGLCDLLGHEIADSALGLLLRAGWIERGAFEPNRTTAAFSSFHGSKPSAWASADDYAYMPVRSSALGAVVVGCIPADIRRCRGGLGRLTAVTSSECAASVTWKAELPLCSTSPGFWHGLMTRKLARIAAEAARRAAYLALPLCTAVHPSAWAFPCWRRGEHETHFATGPYNRSVDWQGAKPAKVPAKKREPKDKRASAAQMMWDEIERPEPPTPRPPRPRRRASTVVR